LNAADGGWRARPVAGPQRTRDLAAGAGPLRVAILSDTHGWVDPRIIEVVADCDLALHGGDIGSVEVLAQLRPRRGAVWAVRGNNDRPANWPESDREDAAQLPDRLDLALPGGQLVLLHGHQTRARGRHERLRGRFPQARAVAYGHSHRLVLDRDLEPWVINPGAAGRDRTHGGPSCLVLVAALDTWVVETYRFPRRPAS
jgi:hypothetical protein